MPSTRLFPGEHATWPLVMGILNVTPDSFSDGGEFLDTDAALRRAEIMLAEGVDVIDVGGESTRPGSSAVAAAEQLRRVIPVIAAIRQRMPELPISVDTRDAVVANTALDAGASIINDISAMQDDPAIVGLVVQRRVPIILMHRRGQPADMQRDGGPAYVDVVSEIIEFLRERLAFARNSGAKPDQLLIDPGIGFGKRVEHNLAILAHLNQFVEIGAPVVIGASRKAFIAASTAEPSTPADHRPRDRMAGSIACAVVATMAGVAVVRVHDVRETVEAIRLCRAIRGAAF